MGFSLPGLFAKPAPTHTFRPTVSPSTVASRPDPSILTFSSSPLSFPPTSSLAAHLLLLESFAHHRGQVLSSPHIRALFPDVDDDEELWLSYLEVAVTRFHTWFDKLAAKLSVQGGEGEKEDGGKLMDLPEDLMPTLEVLMVWHSYLLNPRVYLDDCRRLGRDALLRLQFPWSRIVSAIDPQTLEYALPPKEVGEDEIFITVPCYSAACNENSVRIPISRWHDPLMKFPAPCCNQNVTHAEMWSARLRDDVRAVIAGKKSGLRGSFSPPFQGSQAEKTLTEALTGALDHDGLDCKEILGRVPGPHQASIAASLNKFYPQQDRVRFDFGGKDAAISLAAAVVRQGVFVQRMGTHLWLRSPVLEATLMRAAERYRSFFALFKNYPGKTQVPSLDVDLVWHTHQLNPLVYRQWCGETAGRFIDHDDGLGKKVLGNGWEETKQRFRESGGGELGKCLCWDCETELGFGEEMGKKEKEVRLEFWREVERIRRKGGVERLDVEELERKVRRLRSGEREQKRKWRVSWR